MGAPWRDSAGRFSILKTGVLILLCLPAGAIGWDFVAGSAVRPLETLIRATGSWTIRLLLIALAITPLRYVLRLPQLATVRRMVGVAAFCYAAAHFNGFAADKMFDPSTVAREIVLRIYLTIGATALTLLLALAITSTDGMMRRLGGRRWRGLHKAVHAAALLGVIHFFMQSKLNVTEPTVFCGLLAWLFAWRLVRWRAGPATASSPGVLIALGLGAGALTAFGEALYFHFRAGADIGRVLAVNLGLDAGLRPGWVVLGAGLGVAAAAALAALRRPQTGRMAPAGP